LVYLLRCTRARLWRSWGCSPSAQTQLQRANIDPVRWRASSNGSIRAPRPGKQAAPVPAIGKTTSCRSLVADPMWFPTCNGRRFPTRELRIARSGRLALANSYPPFGHVGKAIWALFPGRGSGRRSRLRPHGGFLTKAWIIASITLIRSGAAFCSTRLARIA